MLFLVLSGWFLLQWVGFVCEEESCATAPSEAAGWDARGLLLCPLCPAQASWLLGPSSGEETNPGSPTVLPHQRGRPTKDAPPAAAHPEVHHMSAASTSRRHMHCQPLWLKANDIRSIQAKQLQQDSPDYHHIQHTT